MYKYIHHFITFNILIIINHYTKQLRDTGSVLIPSHLYYNIYNLAHMAISSYTQTVHIRIY